MPAVPLELPEELAFPPDPATPLLLAPSPLLEDELLAELGVLPLSSHAANSMAATQKRPMDFFIGSRISGSAGKGQWEKKKEWIFRGAIRMSCPSVDNSAPGNPVWHVVTSSHSPLALASTRANTGL